MNKEMLDVLVSLMLKVNRSLSEALYLKKAIRTLTEEDKKYILDQLKGFNRFISHPFHERIATLVKHTKAWMVEYANDDFNVQLGFAFRGNESSSDLSITILEEKNKESLKLTLLLSDELLDKLKAEHKSLFLRVDGDLLQMKKIDVGYEIELTDCDQYEILMSEEEK